MDRITLPLPSTAKVVVIGLGYVGLPLAMAFTKKFRVLGYDISSQRVDDLKQGIDVTNEFSASELELSVIEFSSNSIESKIFFLKPASLVLLMTLYFW